MRSNIECYYCKKKGHYARECRQKNKAKCKQGFKFDESSAFVATMLEEGDARTESLSVTKQTEFIDLQDTNEIWITDSGASRHITFRREWLTDYKSNDHKDTVSLGDNRLREVCGEGTVLIEKFINGQWLKARIENVLYVPSLKKNLFSVGACTKKGFQVVFNGDKVVFVRDNTAQAVGYKQFNNIYYMLFKVNANEKRYETSIREADVSVVNLQELHNRLGHLNKAMLKTIVDKQTVEGIKLSNADDFFCEPCQFGKSHKLQFKVVNEINRSWKLGEYIHSDVCGPFSVESVGGSRYFLSFINEASGYRSIYFLKHKSDVVEKFKDFDEYGRKQVWL